MKTIFKTFILLLITIILSNCGEDDEVVSEPNQIRLKSFIVSTDENTFSYNEENQLISYNQEGVIKEIEYNGNNQISKNGVYTYLYNGQGKIRRIDKEDDDLYRNQYSDIVYEESKLYSQTTYLTYLNSAITRTFHTSYVHNSNNQLIEIIQNESGLSTAYKYQYQYDSNNNIIETTVEVSTDSGITFTTNVTYTYNYDNKKNPHYLTLNKLGVSNSIGFVEIPRISLGIAGYFFRPVYYSPNNLISNTNTSGGSKTYTYRYNNNDYPLTKIRTTDTGSTVNYNYTYEEF